MSVTRRAVLELLATVTDADGATTTTAVLASTLDTDDRTIESHLDGLAACELVKRYGDGRIRITVTGKELLALDTDDVVIVDST